MIIDEKRKKKKALELGALMLQDRLRKVHYVVREGSMSK